MDKKEGSRLTKSKGSKLDYLSNAIRILLLTTFWAPPVLLENNL